MADFGEIARLKREEFERVSRDERQRLENEQKAREAIVLNRVDIIERLVRPLLKKAMEQCALEHIELRFLDQFDVANYSVPRRPSIKVWGASPPRIGDGYQSESPPIFIEADEGKIYVGYGQNSFESSPRSALDVADIGSHEGLLEKAIEHLLQDYFEHLRSVPWVLRS